ncbi:hypothetical protein DU86_00840 [Methanosarcina mazei]|uniref:Uncharacterized protein n=1 Tax=Methanosarcina mazei TaxID=2209 RepID=A0A0F8I5U0_METMZ|nr:hypothetical protein DU31_00655 [Methanosarcina mazei]KKG56855.1 hypothetical protein DU33_17440 [Methanosarcina mazei]KKG58893.1 hypothetical protein DU45_18120 [Methanosarcina mazei]KKG63153.1 hypothetical protein DU64_18455 [Methanosarcina mazei]KKG96221.1 hypothetical protein DU66_19600 [Methanosarcina mazei]
MSHQARALGRGSSHQNLYQNFCRWDKISGGIKLKDDLETLRVKLTLEGLRDSTLARNLLII